MPSIGYPLLTSAYVIPIVRYYVYVRQYWTDTWVLVPHVRPILSNDQTSPSVSDASFLFEFGEMKDTLRGFSSWTKEYAQNFRNWYIRIDIQYDGQVPFTTWIGTVVDDNFLVQDANQPTGKQQMRALGFAHLFDRITMNFARVVAGNGVQTHSVQYVPTFNCQQSSRGMDHAVIGNRSSLQETVGLRQSYVFENDSGNLWTGENIVHYILTYHAPAGLTWVLTGNVEALRLIKEVFKFEGMSAWQALNVIMNRRRGLGFAIRVYPNSNFGWLDVYTETAFPIQVKGMTLPANYRRVFFELPSQAPYTNYLGDIQINTTSINQFDRLLIRSRRIQVAAWFSHMKRDGSIDADAPIYSAWTNSIEAEYTSDLTGDAEDNDRLRSSDKYELVFAGHAVRSDWNGFTRYLSGDFVSAVPLVDNNGGVGFDPDPPYPYQGEMRFERDLPFKVEYNYSTAGISSYLSMNDVRGEYQPLTAFLRLPASETGFPTYCLADRARDGNDNFANASVRPLDSMFGVSVKWRPNHLVADVAVDNTNTDPYGNVTWGHVSFTGMFQSEYRATVQLLNFFSTYSDTLRTFTIDVDADVWISPAGTPFDIDEGGNLLTVHPSNTILRDERYLLYVAAAFAAGWYAVFRQAITIPVNKILHIFDVGSMLTDIRTIYAREPINCTITNRRVDYVRGTTTFETSYVQFDVPAWTDAAAFGTEHYD